MSNIPSVPPHVLMVTHVLPYPPAAGNEIRVLRLLRWFAGRGYRISLVIKPMGVPEVSNESVSYLSSLVENLFVFDSRVTSDCAQDVRLPSDEVGVDLRLAEIQEMFCPVWFSSEVGKLIDSLRPDVVLSEYALMGRVLVSSEYSGFLKIIDSIELFSRLRENLARQGVTESAGLDLSADEERFLLKRADIVLAIQHTECDALAEMLPDRRVLVTAMDLDIPEATRGDCVDGRVLIVGSDNQFNVNGTRHFLSHVWPRVKAEVPAATLHVVGKLSGCLESTDPSVKLLGYVDSIADEYRDASVVVNPCLHGTGLKIKTIEALSWGKAHVGWPVSADGILDLGSLPYVLAHEEESFAKAVCSLLVDDAMRTAHEERSRAFALAHFSPDAVYGPLAALIEAHARSDDSRRSGGQKGNQQTPEDAPVLVSTYACASLGRDGGLPITVHVFATGQVAGLTWSGPGLPSPLEPDVIAGGIEGINRRLHECLGDGEAVVLFVPAGTPFSTQDVVDLVEAMAADPLYGFAMPRISIEAQADEEARMLPHLPESERRVVEGAPLLVRAAIFRDFGLLDAQAANLDSALAQLFARANRRGISARLANRVLMQAGATGLSALRLTRASDHAKALSAQAALPEIRFERLLRHRVARKDMRDVLFDIRNLAAGFNGTAHHVLALMGAFSRLAASRRMRLHFWVLPESAEFHDLYARFPGAIVHQLAADQCFDASVRLTQPWSLTELRDQAYVSTVNVFSVLDTIAWDCHYIRMPHLEGVWRAMADYADGFVFISEFTRQRFLARFPAATAAGQKVAHCSMDPAEYWTKESENLAVRGDRAADSAPYVLIVGNRYYHKGLAEVVPVLSAAFPDVRFKVLGECNGHFHNVEQISSGGQSAEAMAKLFGHCVCLVFPSFYEGFGLPIFEALAFGKPVLARHSDLIDELRERIDPVPDLIPFVTTNELLRELKDLLAQQVMLAARSSPVALPRHPYRWEDSASDVLDLVDNLLARADLERCRKRLEFFYRLEMFDLERAGWADGTQNMVSFEVEKEE
ncbi:hypothetical protein CJ010_21755 [Azoarcus sp. DD4]|uniref:glycosyltransferase n=1 Tax=Azoarcus sp. DD4 TaxID=2027405 RepID=UPI00112D2589|nr:glycosyltransferase [Azoarcus sp. DD4]QDF98972.1 hypothetical protein CJ010_21755 [Azoarcus sp. DD4]